MRHLKKLFFIIMSAVLAVSPIRAQNTAGTDFWITFGRIMTFDNPSLLSFEIRIVGGNEPTWVRIDFTNLQTHIDFNINSYQVYNYILDNTQNNAVYNISMGITDYSIRITTEKPVTVYAMYGFGNYWPITNVLPVTALGTDYYQISYLPTIINGSGLDAYAVLATQNNTQVLHNDILEATLNAGEVYYRTEYSDMTGAHITTNYPVAFFASNQDALIDFYILDVSLFQQLAPINTWGKNFFVPVTENEKDIIRIVASQNGTNITQRGGNVRSGVPGAQTNLTGLQAGEFVELYVHLDSAGCFIETNFPVGVCSYIRSNPSAPSTMPAQTWIPGIEQSVTTALIAPFVPSTINMITNHFALISTPSATKGDTKVSIGGASPTNVSGGIWHDNAISGKSFYSMPLTEHYSTYIFSNPQGMIMLGYGINNTQSATSYYYLAYSAMKNLQASFYANGIYYNALNDLSLYCGATVNFSAEIEGLNTNAGSLKWFINGDEETAAEDQLEWSKEFSDVGDFEIGMWVLFEDGTSTTITGTLTIKKFWVKMRNIKH